MAISIIVMLTLSMYRILFAVDAIKAFNTNIEIEISSILNEHDPACKQLVVTKNQAHDS